MVTISKRANPTQRQIMRIVEGAVKNAADAHPDWPYHHSIGRSISKRAAGTLSAQLAGMLAAKAQNYPPVSAEGETSLIAPPPFAKPVKRSERGESRRSRLSPLRRVWKELSWRVGESRKNNQIERAEALIEMLKVVAALMEKK